MGKRGPKPQSKEELDRKGSWRGKHRKPTPTVQAKQVRAPRWLSPAAKKQWRPLARRLAELGLLSKETAIFWGLFCETWSDYLDVVHRLGQFAGGNGQGGLFGQTGPADTLRLQRLVRLKSELARQLMGGLRDCGLSPSQFNIELQPPDPLERLIRQAEQRKKARFFQGKRGPCEPPAEPDIEDEEDFAALADEGNRKGENDGGSSTAG